MSLQKIYIEKELFDITNFNAPFIYESQGGTSDFRLQNSYFRLSFDWQCKFLQRLCFGTLYIVVQSDAHMNPLFNEKINKTVVYLTLLVCPRGAMFMCGWGTGAQQFIMSEIHC